jgi:hypothetical protein
VSQTFGYNAVRRFVYKKARRLERFSNEKISGASHFKEFRMTRINKAMISLAAAATMLMASGDAGAVRVAIEAGSVSASTLAGVQDGCPIIFPDGPVTVAPNQPVVENQSTVGIINAL